MRSEDIADDTAKQAFVNLHESLLKLSHGTHGRAESAQEQAELERELPVLLFGRIVQRCPLQDEDFTNAGARKPLNFVRQMRDIVKKSEK
jgi:hypothetical protein